MHFLVVFLCRRKADPDQNFGLKRKIRRGMDCTASGADIYEEHPLPSGSAGILDFRSKLQIHSWMKTSFGSHKDDYREMGRLLHRIRSA